MGYFSNGTEGMAYMATYCAKCVHETRNDDGGGCPVMMAHMLSNYEQHSNAAVRDVLGILIPRDGAGNCKCAMFVEVAHE